MTTPPPQDLTCLHFPGRNYIQKETISGGDWGNAGDKNADDPGVNFFPEWTVMQSYCDPSGHCTGSQCDCSASTLGQFGLSDLGGAVWKGAGNCTGGSGWACCGCAIMDWSQDPTNKSQCCNPLGSPIQGSAVHCETGWCPFSPQCENDPTTASYCAANTDDPNCLKICMKYNTQEAVTNGTRPAFCDEFMKDYCVKHQYDSTDNEDLCACITSETPDVVCISAKCTNAGHAWISDEMYKREGNCGTICLQYIKGQTTGGNVNIHGNDFQQACGNTGGSGGSADPWWSWITGGGVVSPGVAPPDQFTQYWWGHWSVATNTSGETTYSRSFKPPVIVGLVVLGLIGVALLLALLRNILVRPPTYVTAPSGTTASAVSAVSAPVKP